MGTVLVIGNGFDLNCGLNTRYSDFFNWCQTNIPGYQGITGLHPQSILMDTSIRSAIGEKEFTVWDLYFFLKSYGMNKDKWCNVEEEISHSFKSGFWSSVLSNINYFLSEDEWGVDDEDWYFAYMLYSRYFNDGSYYSRRGLPKEYFKTRVISDKEFYDALLKELNQLERRFANYLIHEVDAKKSTYELKQKELLRTILNRTSIDEPISILSFNYTGIVSKDDKSGIQSINIHGTLIGQPIFGISSIGNRDSSIEQFTKASRRMIDDLIPLGDFVEGSDHTIVFYGTSLNDLDYDYYYNILHLFNKAKRIYFCYANYDNLDRRSEQIDLAKRLIDRVYGGTFYQLMESGRVKIVSVD